MTDDLKNLPPPEKKVVAKVLVESGMTLRTVGDLLGLSKDSANRYADLEVPEALRHFETKIREQFRVKEQVVAAKALARLDEQVGRARIGEALDVYKVMMDKGQPNQMTQVNIGGEMGVKFEKD